VSVRENPVRECHARFISPVEGDAHLERRKRFWERIRLGQDVEEIDFSVSWEPSDRLGATVRGWLVVDPARTWSSSHLGSESDEVSRK
jgi:hypothetical protein